MTNDALTPMTPESFGQYPEAVAAYKKFLALEPTEKEKYYERPADNTPKAIRERVEHRRHEKTIAACKILIATNPDDAQAYYNMGVAYEKLKQSKLSIAAYKKCIDLDPTDENADRARKSISELSTTQPANK